MTRRFLRLSFSGISGHNGRSRAVAFIALYHILVGGWFKRRFDNSKDTIKSVNQGQSLQYLALVDMLIFPWYWRNTQFTRILSQGRHVVFAMDGYDDIRRTELLVLVL